MMAFDINVTLDGKGWDLQMSFCNGGYFGLSSSGTTHMFPARPVLGVELDFVQVPKHVGHCGIGSTVNECPDLFVCG